MKGITSNLIKFAIVLGILTIAFRFALSKTLGMEQLTTSWIIAVIYGIIVFMFGWVFGKKDHESLPLYDIGFRFHLTTYLICNIIAELWYISNFHSRFESIMSVHMTALFWGIGLLIHFIFYLVTRKNAIKGLKKSEIFD